MFSALHMMPRCDPGGPAGAGAHLIANTLGGAGRLAASVELLPNLVEAIIDLLRYPELSGKGAGGCRWAGW